MKKSMMTFGSALALVALSAGAAFAQFSSINGAVVNQEFHDDALSIFTPVVNYPTQIILSDQAVNMKSPGTYANRDVFRLSDDGGVSAFQFSDTNFFNITFTLTLQGNIKPRKEAGYLIDTPFGQGQFIVNSDGHEVVIFGGPFPFFSFNNTYGLTYNLGDTITLGVTYFQDTDGTHKIVYHANAFDSPAFLFDTTQFNPMSPGIFNGGMIGGYIQVPIDVNNPTNGASATFQNITITPVTGNVVSGTLAFEGIISTAPSQNVTFIFRSKTGAAPFTRTMSVPASGVFTLSNIPADTYNVRIKGDKYLAQVVAVDTTGGAATGVASNQRAGDTNNDNSIDPTDFNVFVSAYNSSAAIPGTGYDARADFNGDGAVDPTDFGLFVGNYNNAGDN